MGEGWEWGGGEGWRMAVRVGVGRGGVEDGSEDGRGRRQEGWKTGGVEDGRGGRWEG